MVFYAREAQLWEKESRIGSCSWTIKLTAMKTNRNNNVPDFTTIVYFILWGYLVMGFIYVFLAIFYSQ